MRHKHGDTTSISDERGMRTSSYFLSFRSEVLHFFFFCINPLSQTRLQFFSCKWPSIDFLLVPAPPTSPLKSETSRRWDGALICFFFICKGSMASVVSQIFFFSFYYLILLPFFPFHFFLLVNLCGTLGRADLSVADVSRSDVTKCQGYHIDTQSIFACFCFVFFAHSTCESSALSPALSTPCSVQQLRACFSICSGDGREKKSKGMRRGR